MILSACAANHFIAGEHELGELSVQITKDGSFSLHSHHFQEAFHHSAGALTEATTKFVIPSELERFKPGETIQILDVCVGLGYNSACLMQALNSKGCHWSWCGLELDHRPLSLALAQPQFRSLWSNRILNLLEQLDSQGFWHESESNGQIIWGDARSGLQHVQSHPAFDLILLDAFSPSRCPELWSHEFIQGLAERLAPQGRLLTYCRAAAVRNSLKAAGLQLFSLLPTSAQNNDWSSGTLAIKDDLQAQGYLSSQIKPAQQTTNLGGNAVKQAAWRPLTQMEKEHLLTRAAVPYRDPDGKARSSEILARRSQEQQKSQLESTKHWQERWMVNREKLPQPTAVDLNPKASKG